MRVIGLKYIIVPFLFIIVLSGFCQTRIITGIITASEDNEPIPGATILVPGTSIGAITNMDGYYSIEIPENADSLEFRSIGMSPVRMSVAGTVRIDVLLKPEIYSMDEVVVTALGISKDVKSLGYSATAFGGEELTKGSDRNILNALQGKVAGVNITSSSGAPGASTRILLRGVSSLTGNNQPLIVIDGVPVSNSQSGRNSINGGTDFGNRLNDLNPSDIESMTILKGAAGTVQYGSRAVNGVIVITTKNGHKSERSKITYNSTVTLERPLRLVQYQNEYGQGIYGNSVLYENMSWGPRFDNKFRPWGHEVDNSLRIKSYSAQEDNVKEFFETGKSFNNSLTIDGGNDQTTYYLSYSNIIWDGIFPTNADSYKKHTLSLNTSHKVTKNLTSLTSLNYLHKKNSFVPTGQGESSVYDQIMQTPRDISLRELSDINEKWNTIDNHYSLYTVNPYHILNNNGNENNEDRIYGRLEFEYKFMKRFSLMWRGGGDISNEIRKEWREKVDPKGNNETSSVSDPGMIQESSYHSAQVNSDLMLTFDYSTEKYGLILRAGTSANQRKSRAMGAQVQNLTLPFFYNISNSTERANASEASGMQRMAGLYGSADISYKNILFLSLNARNEWSSTLPLKNNSFFFPGADLSFVFTELFPSIKDLIPYGKIRASWAKVGNDAAPYQIYSVFVQGGHSDGYGSLYYPLANGVNSFDVGDLIANEKLTPELTQTYEAGTDLRFLNNRFSIDFAYYHKSTTNLIWPAPVAYSTGYSRQMQNLGKLTNYGIEALIGIVPVRTNRWEWSITFNFTRNYNKLNYLNNQLEDAELNALRVDGGQQISWLAIPGMPVGVFKGRGAKYTEDGKMVVDNNGLPIADDDLIIYGNSQYKYFGGVSNNLVYKNLSFTVTFDFRQGGIMYSRTKNMTHWAGTVPATLYNDREPFIIPNSVVEAGTDANGDPVYAVNTKPIDNQYLVEYWGNGGTEIDGNSLLDKSFVKLREVIISYTIPLNLLKKIPFSDISISVIGKNLLLWTPKSQTYIDPEISTFGNDFMADFGEYGAQPSTRSVSFNLKASF